MGHVAHQMRGWVLMGGFSLHPAAVVGVGAGSDKQILVVLVD